MKECITSCLEQKGYHVNSNALSIIAECDDWYCNREISDFHTRRNMNNVEISLSRLNFAKRCCADDANLCEVVSVSPEEGSASVDFIEELIRDNRFDVMYRKQLEKVSASGTVGAYIRLDNATLYDDGSLRDGDIAINYIDAEGVIPLTVENDDITECAFAGENLTDGKKTYTLVIFKKDENGLYSAETHIFNDGGAENTEQQSIVQLGDVKPFAIMRTAEVNNLDNMDGYGLPKIYNCIPMFKALDLCYNLLHGDLDKSDKLVFLNELLADVVRDESGKAQLTKQQKKLFILLGESLPDEKSLIYEYNPTIRTTEITEAFELVLSLISMQFGYGTKKYSFKDGQIQTATEYIGERQDELQELNKQRKQAIDYICDIIHAAMWFSNTFKGTNYDVEEPLSIEFDDSYIEDKMSRLESMRTDAIQFPDIPWLTFVYIKEKYNLSDEDAEKYINEGKMTEEEPEGVE
jgi:A118 family predicted phage portal protein